MVVFAGHIKEVHRVAEAILVTAEFGSRIGEDLEGLEVLGDVVPGLQVERDDGFADRFRIPEPGDVLYAIERRFLGHWLTACGQGPVSAEAGEAPG